MIHLRRSGQRSFAEGLIEEEIEDLWEPWMRQADKVLDVMIKADESWFLGSLLKFFK